MPSRLPPVEVPQGQDAYRRLIEDLRRGQLRPGDRLTETELAGRLGISRTPVREAIRRLEANGLVVHQPHVGASVRVLSYGELTELYDMRAVFESTAARLASRTDSEIELAEMDAINAEMQRAGADSVTHFELNRQFHGALVGAACNRFLSAAVDGLQKTMLCLGPTTMDGAGRFDPDNLDGLTTEGIVPAKTNWARPIERPPFHAFPLRSGVTFTYLGLTVGGGVRVTGASGLYENLGAAGEIVAGSSLRQGYLAGFAMTIGTVLGGSRDRKPPPMSLDQAALGPASRTDAIPEARRQIEICNACRYWEGYCSVFPAMTRGAAFSDGDIAQLANLCHNCRGCYYACQYIPRHDVAVHLPAALTVVQAESWEWLAWPQPLIWEVQRRSPSLRLALLAGFALILWAAELHPSSGPGPGRGRGPCLFPDAPLFQDGARRLLFGGPCPRTAAGRPTAGLTSRSRWRGCCSQCRRCGRSRCNSVPSTGCQAASSPVGAKPISRRQYPHPTFGVGVPACRTADKSLEKVVNLA